MLLFGGLLFGPWRAGVDPRTKQSDLFCREPLSFRRHDLVFVVTGDFFKQDALRTLARDHQRLAAIAALEDAALAIEANPALLLFLAMALVAAAGKDRPDVAVEIDRRFSRADAASCRQRRNRKQYEVLQHFRSQ
jgi:hypothetical protein